MNCIARILPLLIAVAALMEGSAAATAQEPMQSQAQNRDSLLQPRFALRDGKTALQTAEYFLSLTAPEDQQQWPTVEGFLESLLEGVDRTRPMRMDLLLGGEETRYRTSIPVANFRLFEKNIRLLGVKIRRIRDTRIQGTLYQTQDAYPGFMRFHQGYATFAKTREALIGYPDPRKAIDGLVARYHLAFENVNPAPGPQVLDALRRNFAQYRKQEMADLQRRQGATEADFALRQALRRTWLDEAERFYVEAERILLGWTTDTSKGQGRIDITVTPIPETSLAKAVNMLGQRPSYFAGLARHENSILSFRVNHPLDPARRENLLETGRRLQAEEKAEIQAREGLTESQRTAAREVVDLLYALHEDVVRGGVIDAFAEVHTNPSGHKTLLAGIQAPAAARPSGRSSQDDAGQQTAPPGEDAAPSPERRPQEGSDRQEAPPAAEAAQDRAQPPGDRSRIVHILELLPRTGRAETVQLDADREGDVRIHAVTVSPQEFPHFEWFFGETTYYVGESDQAAWIAAGENALAELKSAIQQAGVPPDAQADPTFFRFFAQLAPWLELRQRRSPEEGDPELRQMALEAFQQGQDTVSLRLQRVENRVEGELLADRGILRLFGKLIAEFSRETLQ